MHNIQTEDKILFYLCLHRITFLSLCEKEILLKELDDFNALALLSKEEISRIIHRQISEKAIWNGKDNLRMAKIALEYCKFLNIRIVLNSDENYPFLLKQISDPPLLLFCRGNAELLNGRKYISVVGTRKLSAQGRDCAWNFAYQAAKNGYCVVSGLAYGADGYAHKGSVDAYFDFLDDEEISKNLGHTIAVLPSGIDEIVPYRHKQLAQMILKSGGCIISEYEPKMNIANWHFVARNRIIAGLSESTVVIEAPNGSGSLITADFALEYGREVFLHKACFSEMALKMSDIVKKDLLKKFSQGTASKYKLENTVQKFLEEGAPVIEDFDDFCAVLNEEPGIRNAKIVQAELFASV